MKVNWDAIGAVGEIVGAAAVVLSLVYLAVQIRLQNRESRASTIMHLTEQWNSSTLAIAQNAELAKIWTAGLRGETLPEDERARFFGVCSSVLQVSEGLYLQQIDGRLDPRIWQGVDARLSNLLATRGFQAFWLVREPWFSKEFSDFVADRIAKSGITDGTLYAEGSA